MNFQEMDALGGLLEGSKFRMAEDTTRINQHNVMEQIAKAAQDRQFEAEMHPLKKQAEEALVRDRDLSAKVRQQQLDQGQEKFTREQGQAYVQDVIQQGSLPGAEDFFATKYKVPADHPIRMAVKQAREQRDAVEAIQKAGGQVSYDYGRADASRTNWLQDILGRDFFFDVSGVYLNGTGLSAEVLREAREDGQTSQLRSFDAHMTDDELAVLKKLPRIKDLTLCNTKVTDAGLANLTDLRQLSRLHFIGCFSDTGLEHLEKNFRQSSRIRLAVVVSQFCGRTWVRCSKTSSSAKTKLETESSSTSLMMLVRN